MAREKKMIVWEDAEKAFDQSMEAFRDEVKRRLTRSNGLNWACWQVFLRVWKRAVKRGREEISKQCFPQVGDLKYGPVFSRSKAGRK